MPVFGRVSCTAAMLIALGIAHPLNAQVRAEQRTQVPRSAPGPFVGCYDVDLGAWSPHAPEDSIFYMPPSRVQLSLASGRSIGDRPHNALETAPGAMPATHRYSSWQIVEPDSVAMRWSTGFAGMDVRLTGRDTLTGLLRTFTDMGGSQRYTAAVTAIRVACDAPLDLSRRLTYLYSPVVRLANGDSLMLDARPPAHLNIPPSARAHFLDMSALPPYQDAQDVSVSMHDGVVISMTVHFSDDVGFERLFERLTAEFGPPTTPPQPDRRVAWWYSRLINIGLADHTVDDYGLRVHIVTPAR